MREALVIGASGALGGASAVALAEAGFEVCLGYGRNHDQATSLAQALTDLGHRATTAQIDLRDADLSSWARLDALVLAAGAELQQPWLSEADPRDLKRVVDIELMLSLIHI